MQYLAIKMRICRTGYSVWAQPFRKYLSGLLGRSYIAKRRGRWYSGLCQFAIRRNYNYLIQMNDAQSNFEDQPLTEHLRELRSCLIYSFAAIFIGFCLSYVVIRPIGTWFFKPLTEVLPEGTSLIFTSYQEGFFFI